jgi:hypothetical protein
MSQVPIPHMTAKGVRKERVYLWEWLVDSLNAKDGAGIEKRFNHDERTLNGHCFSDTFRHPNNVHTLLKSKEKDWFLGHYACRRDAKLLEISAEYGGGLSDDDKKILARRVTGDKNKTLRAITQTAVTQKYDAKQSAGHGAIVTNEGMYKGTLRTDADKPGPYRIFDFHGVRGQAPEQFVNVHYKGKK